ncbi:MAG: hypothetical protein FWF23_06200 [Alphaproteobacteria bacterium]|nr:hypothetical protein [Alphaproteobacteria bacterium]MCL2505549.1 hypothetical protein [Alphaproteobacteria bacterium]
MPYIQKDKSGNIVKISSRVLVDGESVPHNDPDVVAFLRQRGQDPNLVAEALDSLRRSDSEMVRSVEDVILLLMRKNVIKMNELPVEVQNRISLRARYRIIIQDIYDQASARVL